MGLNSDREDQAKNAQPTDENFENELSIATERHSPMLNREQREVELKGLLNSHVGRNQLTQLLRQYMNIPAGQIPLNTPFIQTILDHEFGGPQAPN
jgi:hypothetical protein